MDNKPLPFDFSKIGINELIHYGIITLHEYYEKINNTLPELNDDITSNEILKFSKNNFRKSKSNKFSWKNWFIIRITSGNKLIYS